MMWAYIAIGFLALMCMVVGAATFMSCAETLKGTYKLKSGFFVLEVQQRMRAVVRMMFLMLVLVVYLVLKAW